MVFYFNIRSEDTDERDEEGIDLSSLDAARFEAVRSAREMVAELVLHDKRIDGMRFEIADASGDIVAVVPFRDVIRFD